MGVVECESRLGHQLDRLVHGEPLAAPQDLVQGLALHPLHGDVGDALLGVGAGVVDGDDAGMVEASGGLRLGHEALLELLLHLGVDALGAEDLERHLAPQAGVVDQVDASHRPSAQLGEDSVATDLLGSLQNLPHGLLLYLGREKPPI